MEAKRGLEVKDSMRRVNVVDEDRMMGGCRRRRRKEGHLLLWLSRPEERDEHVGIYRKG